MFKIARGSRLDFGEKIRDPEELNLIPLINVVFLLLIFFLIATTLTTPDSLEVSLPKSESSGILESETIVVLIGDSGQIVLNDKKTQPAELVEEIAALLAAGNSRSLMIKADAAATTAQVLMVLRRARAAGAERIALATQAIDP